MQSRVERHSKLYQEINNQELDNYTIKSNETVIGSNDTDVQSIKKILDTRYSTNTPKRKSIRLEEKESIPEIKKEDTKEYDLNTVIAKAKDEKQDNYEEEKGKKLRNTQYDILNNLKIDEEPKNNKNKAEDELMELINTITINEERLKEKDVDPLDILTDLKGTDDTQVYESMSEEVKIEVKPEEEKNEKIDKSFYTNNVFKDEDFDDDKTFVEETKLNVGIKILIVLIVIVFIAGLVIFLKSFL